MSSLHIRMSPLTLSCPSVTVRRNRKTVSRFIGVFPPPSPQILVGGKLRQLKISDLETRAPKLDQARANKRHTKHSAARRPSHVRNGKRKLIESEEELELEEEAAQLDRESE
jgi:hypothetical protein